MRKLPLIVQIYVWAVVSLGMACFVYSWFQHWDASHPYILGLGLVGVFFGSFVKVVLYQQRSGKEVSGNNLTMSVGFVPTFLLVFYLGPFAGEVAALLSVFTAPRDTVLYRRLFSTAVVMISVFLAGLVLQPFHLSPGIWLPLALAQQGDAVAVLSPLLGIFLATLIFYLTNTSLVATAMGLVMDSSPFTVWRDNLFWTGPGYFAGASCATAILILLPYTSLSHSNQIVALTLFLVAMPFGAVMFFTFKYHTERDELRLARIESLHQNRNDLEVINSQLQRSKDELQHLYTATVESLALAIDAKDRYTKEHIQRVKGIAVALARELGLSGDELKAVETGALLHDVGKIAVPEHILTKPGKLTEEEFDKIKTHPDMGARILEPVRFPYPVMPIVRHHHERWNGTGYPDGLAGEAIPLGGRILAVADVYDALTSDRAYRRGMSHDEAVDHLTKNSGSHFDPNIVHAFLSVVAKQPELFVSIPGSGSADPKSAAEGINRASFENSALYEISQALSATVHLDEILTVIAEKIKSLFQASTCVIRLCETVTVEHMDSGARITRAVGELKDAFESGELLDDAALTAQVTETCQGVIRSNETDKTLSFPSTVIAPLIDDKTVLGTVHLYQRSADAFDPESLRILQAIGMQAGPAIQRAIEFDRTRESALTDVLTGLHNARHLYQFLDHELEIAGREEHVLSVLVLDLDNFKPVNDQYGHTHGNAVLRDLGHVFQNVLRSGDLVARYAGDEFVIVLPRVGPLEAVRVAEKIRKAVGSYDARPAGENGAAPVRIDVSIGQASYPGDGGDSSSLIRIADHAMFRDKEQRKA